MRRFKYMLWLLVAVFCLMPCGVSAAETQKDLKIQEVFQRYGKKRNVTMVELSNEMLETYGMTRYKSITIKDDPEALRFTRQTNKTDRKMKRILLVLMACFPVIGLMAAEVEPLAGDTIITLERKRIEVKDNGDRMKVRVYEVDEDGDSVDDELIFEGHYRDGQSYERRKHVKSINIPVPTWDKDFNPHWAGFGMGFANFADGSLHVNDVDGVSLRSGNSLEYNLNVLEKAFPFSRYRWAVVIGAGMRWSRYRIDTNEYFKEIDGVTALRPAPEGVTLKASKLNITSLTIPLLLEWQPKKRSSEFFLSAGVVGVIKTCSSSKIVYNDASGKKHKEKMDSGMNIRPVTMDFLFQAGWDWIGLYAKYSPIDLFENGKGPKVHPVSIGLQLHL